MVNSTLKIPACQLIVKDPIDAGWVRLETPKGEALEFYLPERKKMSLNTQIDLEVRNV